MEGKSVPTDQKVESYRSLTKVNSEAIYNAKSKSKSRRPES